MLVLGIETSCDETALALLEQAENDGSCRLIGEVISSQNNIHERYGGVVPELAAREHMRNLPLLLEQVLADAKIVVEDLDLIAVTSGPGLHGCLLMGIAFAKGLAISQDIPILGVNHIEGHLLIPCLEHPQLSFPYLALVVSGGHTEIQQVTAPGKYKVLARTIDDAAGEAFDKSAHLLGFAYPGGAQLAAVADTARESRFKLPKVMRAAEGFSFAGLKTAVSLLVRGQKEQLHDARIKAELCFSIQEAIVDALIFKLRRAMEETGIDTLVVTGGVSANRRLRAAVSALARSKVFFPQPLHCTDNAAMIAYAGALGYRRGVKSDLNLSAKSRWAVEELQG